MKPLALVCLGSCLLSGCMSSDSGRGSRTAEGIPLYRLDDQPQTAVVGDGPLMPGAYQSRQLETGQFTGRERTSGEIGQRPSVPPQADARDLARTDKPESVSGAGSLGQSGIVPGEPVSSETLLEDVPIGAPAHVAVVPPGSETGLDQQKAVGAGPSTDSGSGRSTNAPAQGPRPDQRNNQKH